MADNINVVVDTETYIVEVTDEIYTVTVNNVPGPAGPAGPPGDGGVPDLSTATTTDLAEGTNLYYTDERVDDRVAALLVEGNNTTLTYDDAANTLTVDVNGTSGTSETVQTAVSSSTGDDFTRLATIDGVFVTKSTFHYDLTVDFAATVTPATILRIVHRNVDVAIDIWYNTATQGWVQWETLGPSGADWVTTDIILGATVAGYFAAEAFNISIYNGNQVMSSDFDFVGIITQVAGTDLYNSSYFDIDFASKSTTDLSEGTNLYFTDARANAAIDTRVNKAFIDALNVDADTLDGIDSTGFATAAQGAKADTALQPAAIGTTVQGYSAVLAGTTASFTTADESKLDGIESGATADQTAGEIKTLYESNLDTNAFTDAEKTKLTGIESGATADQTAGEILTALLTVDGATSNLDADLLDGQQGTYYLDYTNFTNTPTIPSTTTQISEGTNLYFTDERVDDRVNALLVEGSNITLTYDDIANTLTIDAAGGGTGVTDGDKGDITVSASGATWTIDDDTITNAKLANMATGRFKGRTTTGTGDPEDLTTAQATALLDTFTTGLKGLAPASGGGTVNYLRADGTWAEPPSGGGGATSLGGLSDVTLTTPVDGALFAYDLVSTQWIDVGTFASQFDTALATKSTTNLTEGTNLYYTQGRFDSSFTAKSTTDLSEGTNLYYTTARQNTDFDTRLATKSTTDLSEGTNLYYTNARVDARIGLANLGDLVDVTLTTPVNGALLAYNTTGSIWEDVGTFASQFDTALATKSTTNLTEGTNLYYTTTRANSAIDTRVNKAFIDALNVDADTLDGIDSTGFATSAQGTLADSALQSSDIGVTVQGYSLVLANTTASFTTADESKLDGIESGATADQTAGEIKTLYESNLDTNAFTDAEKTKLTGIAVGAEVNTVDSVNTQTGAVVLDADDISDAVTTNKFTTAADISKLAGIESGATADQTAGEILTALLTVDGPTSLLNADLLDNQEGTYYLDYTNFTNTPTIPSTTTDISEGTNLYFTNERVDDRVAALLVAGANITLTYDDLANTLTIASTGSGGGGTLNDLTDVTITAAATGEVLRYNGTAWVDATLSTTDVTEGTNLYYTQGRFDTAFTAKSTTDLSEGTNLYYTDARVDARIGLANLGDLVDVTLTTPVNGALLAYNTTGSIWEDSGTFASQFDTALATKTTTNLTEGTNLYYTTARQNTDFDTRLATKSTTDLAEGTNLYYTDGRVTTLIGSTSINALSDVDTATSAPADGEVLTWVSATSKWEPSAISGGASVVISDTAPGTPSAGDLWYNSSNGMTYIYYNDGDSSQWVNITSAAASTAQGLKFDITFQLDEGDDDTFTIHQSSSFEYTIDSAYYQTDSGTISANIQIGGTSVTGLSALSLSSTPANSTATAANTVAVNGKVTVVTTSNATATNAVITLRCTRTGN